MSVTATHAPGTFCWADMGTPDAEASKRFYTGLFGWTSEDGPIGDGAFYTMFQMEGRSVCAVYQQDEQLRDGGVPPSWLSYVSVESADLTAAKVRELGGTVMMEPFDVLDAGRMTLLSDPVGAVLGAWEPRRHIGAEVMGEPGSICWDELLTSDVDAAARFYALLLEWDVEPRQVGAVTYHYIKNQGQEIGGMLAPAGKMAGIPAQWLLYFAVADCDESHERALSLGASVKVRPTDVPGVGRFAVIEDPQGAVFSIIHLLPAQS